jgi:putative hemolysin
MNSPLFWLIMTLLCVFIQAFFAMMEMAAVSFNKVRLQYYVSKGLKRAKWLASLLSNPPRLFGTALFGVNLALQVGSECSRRLYLALGFNPDLAPITQVIIVLVFAELAPLFAARKFSGHVIMSGIPILYTISKILIPITWSIGLISRSINYLLTGSTDVYLMNITRDELQRALEEQKYEVRPLGEDPDFNLLVGNIMTLQKKLASHLMIPLHKVHMVSSSHTGTKIRELLDKSYHPFLPVYEHRRDNIIGIIDVRDLIKADLDKECRTFIDPPWFVILDAPASEILNQFRHNKQKVSVVLDREGQAIGILTLDLIVKALFGENIDDPIPIVEAKEYSIVDRTLPGELLIKDFNKEFNAQIEAIGCSNLAELVHHILGHLPEPGELIRVGPFEMRIEEVSLGNIKSVLVRSII